MAIHVAQLRANDKERREDISRHEAALGRIEESIRKVGAQVMLLWWGFVLLLVVEFVGFLSQRQP